ncbi:hypothetical protein GXN76_02165 [Kroppenstedtia pulmonis]|uniref:Uncharacterized protein n=1 Tax=Kroppenstedtia pulmonis TaxID=1380685 RepID=A0A7D4BEB3_9BACL|nr:hypothetical protein [Kroppenstedtia pulmonis]QKG83392.1 hypothetical protein GXN76_02165 [Kroppenstedtia pulmonis]
MVHRWVGGWLVFFYGLPVLVSFLFIVVYQILLNTKEYYWFWLGQTYFYLILPVVAVAIWWIHWGKKYPVRYFLLTLFLLGAVIWIGILNGYDNWGVVKRTKAVPLGLTDKELILKDDVYEVPYYPVNKERLIQAVRSQEEVTLYQVEGKRLVLAFEEDGFQGYSWIKRLQDIGIGILAVGVFGFFFVVAMNIWWRSFDVEKGKVIIHRWGFQAEVPLRDVIQIKLDKENEEIQVETEEMEYNFPYREGVAGKIVSEAVQAALVSFDNGKRWFRKDQYQELKLQEDRLFFFGQEERSIAFEDIQFLSWDPVVRIVTEDESSYSITDYRYTDRAWFDELIHLVRRVWVQKGMGYQLEVHEEERCIQMYTDEWIE